MEIRLHPLEKKHLEWLLKIRDDEIGGMLNQYGQSFFEFSDEPKNIKYLADSRHSWDYGHPLDYKHMDFLQILTHPDDYESFINELQNNDCSISKETRRNLAVNAFKRTAMYDSVIHNFFSKKIDEESIPPLSDKANPFKFDLKR